MSSRPQRRRSFLFFMSCALNVVLLLKLALPNLYTTSMAQPSFRFRNSVVTVADVYGNRCKNFLDQANLHCAALACPTCEICTCQSTHHTDVSSSSEELSVLADPRFDSSKLVSPSSKLDVSAPAKDKLYGLSNAPYGIDTRLRGNGSGILFYIGTQTKLYGGYRHRWTRNGGRAPFYEELLRALASLRTASPTIPFTVFTDAVPPSSIVAAVRLSGVGHIQQLSYRNTNAAASVKALGGKIDAMLATPYARTLFIDADAMICDDLRNVFEMLHRFDVAAAPEDPWISSVTAAAAAGLPGHRWHHGTLSMLNTGVLLYRSSAEAFRFLSAWQRSFATTPNEDTTDQVVFDKLWRDGSVVPGVRFLILPRDLNLRVHSNTLPAWITGRVRILHSRYTTCSAVNGLPHAAGATNGSGAAVSFLLPRLFEFNKPNPIVHSYSRNPSHSSGSGVTSPWLSTCRADTALEAHDTRFHVELKKEKPYDVKIYLASDQE